MPEPPEAPLDGNASAGVFAEVFAVDVTAARVTCEACGHRERLADTAAYVRGPGTVLRCRRCGNVLARIASHSGAAWLDLRGSALWRLPLAQ